MYAVIDAETTGLSPKDDRIIELAIIGLDPEGSREWEWCSLINPERDTGSGLVRRIHQIYPTDVEGAPTFSKFAGLVADMLSGRAIIAHNAQFDVGMLGAEYERLGVRLPTIVQVCTATVAKQRGLWPCKLEACCASLGIEMEGAHHALADARATWGVAERLIDFSAAPFRQRISTRIDRIGSWPSLPVMNPQPLQRPILPKRQPASRKKVASAGAAERPGGNDIPVIETASVDREQPEARYLAALEEALENRTITSEQELELANFRGDLGLSESDAAEIHMEFLRGLAGSMWADGKITRHEEFDLKLVAEALGLGPEDIEEARERPLKLGLINQAYVLEPGDKVVFTGEMSLPRGEWKTRAEAAGLKVTGSVSGKTDFLVVPFGETGSSKSRKARERGVPVVSEQRFKRMIMALEKKNRG